MLREIFPLAKVYQEYPYDLILKRGYSVNRTPKDVWNNVLLREASRFHADWVILDYCTILEYNGEHHYRPIDYKNDHEAALASFARRQILDRKKKYIANEAQFSFLEIPFFEEIDIDSLYDMVIGGFEND
jgi:hypothetical protein